MLENVFREVNRAEFLVIEKALDRMYRDYDENVDPESGDEHPDFPEPDEEILEERLLVAYVVDANLEFMTAILVVKPTQGRDKMYVGTAKRMHKDAFDPTIGSSVALSRAVRNEPIIL